MTRLPGMWLVGALGVLALAGCGDDAGDAGDADAASSGCTLTEHTTATAVTSENGCAVLERDTSACDASRTAAGLDGFWLGFSCRVELAAAGTTVTATADGLPDYLSFYFLSADACHEDYSDGIHNPNTISTQHYVMSFPAAPTAAPQEMRGAVVGMARNGVAIYANFAAPGDDIFTEALTFDRCGAHPQNTGQYHYHAEPYAISNDDDRFIGVMRDGYPIYGRRDPDGGLPTLDASGGHTGPTADSAGASTYHYHVNLQTSTTAGTAGEQQWFLTTGQYAGAPGTCTGC